MSTAVYECPKCRERLLLRFGTDGNGRTVESRDKCRCERGLSPREVRAQADAEEAAEKRTYRRRAGICQDCEAPVAGTVGKALRCAEHKLAARRKAGADFHQRHLDARRAKDKKRWRKMQAEARERRYARRRELHQERMASDPVYAAEYRKRRQRETLFSSPGRPKYMATQRKHNANPACQQRKRELARTAYLAEHPQRPAPVCVTCGAAIPWEPKPKGASGRPPKYCYRVECIPYPISRARRERLAFLASAHTTPESGRGPRRRAAA